MGKLENYGLAAVAGDEYRGRDGAKVGGEGRMPFMDALDEAAGYYGALGFGYVFYCVDLSRYRAENLSNSNYSESAWQTGDLGYGIHGMGDQSINMAAHWGIR